MPELQRLRADHVSAVLAFELANRAYFANFISDRGDKFFDHFGEAYNELLAEQEAGTSIFHVLIGEDGTVLGLFNLRDVEDDTAVLGYRVASTSPVMEWRRRPWRNCVWSRPGGTGCAL